MTGSADSAERQAQAIKPVGNQGRAVPDSGGRSRSSAHRLTLPGFAVLATVVLLITNRADPRVDGQIIALILVVLAGLAVLGIAGPFLTTRRVKVVGASTDLDAVEGRLIDVHLRLEGRADRVTVRVLDPPGDWFHTAVPAVGVVPHLAERRGVFPLVRVEVQCSWPLGLYVSGRTHLVDLDRPIHVAPRPDRVQARPGPLPAELTEMTRPSPMPAPGDVVRSVRPYQHGDPPRLVHWASTARMGELVVRELEPPVRPGLVVVLDLRCPDRKVQWPPVVPNPLEGVGAELRESSVTDAQTDAAAVEAAARRAAGLVASALRSGAEVLLSTHEIDGPRLAPVATTREAGRRLAAAVDGEPPTAPAGWPVEVVRADELRSETPRSQSPAVKSVLDGS